MRRITTLLWLLAFSMLCSVSLAATYTYTATAHINVANLPTNLIYGLRGTAAYSFSVTFYDSQIPPLNSPRPYTKSGTFDLYGGGVGSETVATNTALVLFSISSMNDYMLPSDGASVTITPAGLPGTISPSSRSTTMVGTTPDFAANFTGTGTSAKKNLSGIVYKRGYPLVPQPGILMATNAPATGVPVAEQNAVTDINGVYTMTFNTNWSCRIYPIQVITNGDAYYPTNFSYSNQVSQNFYLVSTNPLVAGFVTGRVIDRVSSNGVSGITLDIAGAGAGLSTSVTTDGNGNYSYDTGYSNTVTVTTRTAAGVTYNPTGYTLLVPIQGTNAPDIIYYGPYRKIVGRVTKYGTANYGLSGIRMTPSSGTAVDTDGFGYYAFYAPPGFTGTITPQSPPRVFQPVSRSYADLTVNMPNQNFQWIPAGVTYADPLDSLVPTNLTEVVPFSFATAGQVSTKLGIGGLQNRMSFYDSTFGTMDSTLRAQRDILGTWVYPSYLGSATNAPYFWGSFIIENNWWKTNTATYSAASVGSMTGKTVSVNTGFSLNPRRVASTYDSQERLFGVLTNSTTVNSSTQTFLVAPVFNTGTNRGVYRVRLSTSSRRTLSRVDETTLSENFALRFSGTNTNNMWSLSSSTTNSGVGLTTYNRASLSGSVYLGTNSFIYPYITETPGLFTGNVMQVYGSTIFDVQYTPLQTASTDIWR